MNDSNRIGHVLLTGVFAGVALMFGARWWVVWDYQTVDAGDHVIVPHTPDMGGGYTVQELDGPHAIITDDRTGKKFRVNRDGLLEQ